MASEKADPFETTIFSPKISKKLDAEDSPDYSFIEYDEDGKPMCIDVQPPMMAQNIEKNIEQNNDNISSSAANNPVKENKNKVTYIDDKDIFDRIDTDSTCTNEEEKPPKVKKGVFKKLAFWRRKNQRGRKQ